MQEIFISTPSWPTTPEEEAYWQNIEEIYLNTGSWGSMPYAVFETMTDKLKELEGNPTRNRKPLAQSTEHAREMLADFVHASAADITFLPNVTVAINIVLHGHLCGNWNTGVPAKWQAFALWPMP
jgi:selenocysteine lyase/cysteine desulfurase